MAVFPFRMGACALCASLALAGCDENGQFTLLPPSGSSDVTEPAPTTTTKLVERDVEAPDVFQANENGLWDGRPSLGGVWVAYPGVTDPERVIIRNESNGKFVIGALFRRERENPGPKIQVSSDAASALGMLAGQPTLLNVTALRKQEVPEEPVVSNETIESAELDPIAAAAAAIDAAEGKPMEPVGDITPAAGTAAPAPVATTAAAPASGSLTKPFVQIGIFSIESNASSTASLLRGNGIEPTVYEQESNGKKFWRVVVGPASSSADRSALLKKVKGLGFGDAYAVTN
ncbi:sporulation related protein [Actibacterium atlanticum]|uniref:Sporulation related protein n=1 Tax=Actibacterium atlanticum TaxID=1461693 RepID=A0A058ZKY9_9RHOB|nr:SPOR domain-containing protein [Actibacterium atlanticum]KCV81862.1 sporulation related protein [Actibacterium atlanticum]